MNTAAPLDLATPHEWDARIRRALTRSEFVLFAQPVVPLQSDDGDQHELLLRLQRGEQQTIAPGAFLPAAERSGLVLEIDRWVITAAVRLLAELAQADMFSPVQVNLSALSVSDPALPAVIGMLLSEYDVNPQQLIFELTETAALSSLEQAVEFARQLQGLGCRFALDDFGAGFAGFRYLKHLPLDYLKIDGEFVRNLRHDPSDQILVRSMAELGHQLGKRTIAEFVEDEETVELLRSYGVDFGQGFHLGRPQPAADLFGA